jgi:predicted phage replisome organizer
MKKLRKIAGGDTYTIIYLKMALATLKTGGMLIFEGLEDTFADEIALEIDESPDDVSVTLNYLMQRGLITSLSETEISLTYVVNNLGSEGASARRVREHRERKTAELQGIVDSPPPIGVTGALHCNGEALHCADSVTESKNKSKSKSKRVKADKPPTPAHFAKPTVEDVKAYCIEQSLTLDPHAFVDYYESVGWIVGKNKPMKDWKAAARRWARGEKKQSAPAPSVPTINECLSPDDFEFDLPGGV